MSRYRTRDNQRWDGSRWGKDHKLHDTTIETHERKHFDTSNEFADWFEHALAERRDPKSPLVEYHYSNGTGPRRVLQGIKYLREGASEDAAEADALLEKFTLDIESIQYIWDDDIAGSAPDVPLALAGVPEHMMSLEVVPNDHSPLRVWVGLTSSAGVTEAQLRQRGIVLAAFAMAMQEVRPVWITPYISLGWLHNSYDYHNGTHTAILSWDVQTSPLVISELLGCTSKPDVTRYIGLCACNLLNPYVDGICPPVLTYDDTEIRAMLGADEGDLVLPAISWDDPMLRDPIKWVNEQVERYRNPTPSIDQAEDMYYDPNR